MRSGSDLFSKLGSRPDDSYSHWKVVMAVGLVMGAHAIFEMTIGGVDFDWNSVMIYLPVSALYILSMIFGYAGLRYIELSISSPICNSSGAITSLLCFFVLGQSMTGLQFVGVTLVCLGVIGLAALERSQAVKETVDSGEEVPSKYSKSFLAVLSPSCTASSTAWAPLPTRWCWTAVCWRSARPTSPMS